MTQATITYLGRIVALEPAALGGLFEDELSITLVEEGEADPKNNWQRSKITIPQVVFWYDKDPQGVRKLFTFSGYGPRIVTKLKQLGYEVVERDWLPCGLGAPQFNKLPANMAWRGSQPKVLASILANRCGTVVCPTGWGKSYIMRLLMLLHPEETIIFTVPSVDIARETHKALFDFDARVGFVGDGTVNPQRVTVAVSHSLKHCHKQANLLVGDEAHALVSERFRRDLVQFPRAKFIGMTASPTGRTDGGDQYVEALFGPIIADVPYQEAVDTGNIVPLDVWVFLVPHGPSVQHIQRKDLKDRMGIWANDYRNKMIKHAVEYAQWRLNDPNLQILIMVDKTEHAFRLQQLLPEFTVVTGEQDADDIEKFQKSGVMLPGQQSCTRKDRDRYKEEFSAGRLKRVISTYVWSKGVNFLDLNVLIRADGTSTPIASTQIPGRLSRLGSDGDKGKGILIDFNDLFSPDLQNRSRSRFKVYRQHGFKIEAISE